VLCVDVVVRGRLVAVNPTHTLATMSGVIVLETLTCVAGQKRKAAEADLPDRVDTDEEVSCGAMSVDALPTSPIDVSGDERAYRFFEHMWSLFIRPEMEKVFGPAPPLPPVSLLSQQLTQMQPIEDIPEPPAVPLTELTSGEELDVDDSECVATQPMSPSDCSCETCGVAGSQTIDQFSDSDQE
jgi:hypothetical protein